MRVIIAGSRTLTDYQEVCRAMSDFGEDVTEVLSGCQRGADRMGEIWAAQRRIPIRRFPADWDKWGHRAGPRRNQQMAQQADALVAVWDGSSSGTADMIRKAQAWGRKVHIHYVRAEEELGSFTALPPDDTKQRVASVKSLQRVQTKEPKSAFAKGSSSLRRRKL